MNNIPPEHRDDTATVVAGGGLVGATTALALLQRGSPVQWLRPALSTPALPDGYAARVYALSPDNLAWLETLGVGTQLQHGRIGSVQAMEIRGPQGGLLELSARQTGVPQMAVIVESDNLQLAVDAAIAAAGGDDRLGAAASAQITAIDAGDSGMAVSLDDGVRLNTPLLVAADGANSPLRALAGIDTVGDSYHHRAVVANFECERPHRGIACQWFNHGEVLAWLPLPDRHISMVWSVPDSRAETLLGLDDAALVAMVGAAGDHRWGDLRLVSRPHSFALRRQRAQRLVGPRLALVGDAAHVVHPLAGQGLNLGLRDVRELLAATRSARDPGEARLLNRYQALRQHDVRAIECLTDGLFRLFKSPLAGYLGGQGLSLLNHVSPIKSQLVKLALR